MKGLVWAAVAAAWAIGCGGADDPAAEPDPTFTRVTAQVITLQKCGGPLCHGLTAGGFTLGPKSTLHAALVGQPASANECKDSGFVRVVPEDPEASLLYLKLNHEQPCGDEMPVGSRLEDSQIELVRAWIEAGALDD